MRIRAWLGVVVGISLAFFAVRGAQGQNAIPDRLPRVIAGDGARTGFRQTVSPRASGGQDLGPTDPARALSSMSLRFSMTEAQQEDLGQLLLAQQNPASPLFHHWLTPEQFGARFGLSAGDLASISGWLQAQGFTITGVARGRTFVQFSGTVAQANQAFGVTLHNVSVSGLQHIANLSAPTLPATLAG